MLAWLLEEAGVYGKIWLAVGAARSSKKIAYSWSAGKTDRVGRARAARSRSNWPYGASGRISWLGHWKNLGFWELVEKMEITGSAGKNWLDWKNLENRLSRSATGRLNYEQIYRQM